MTETQPDSTGLPRWLLFLLVAQAVLLWGLWIGVVWFARPHWTTFLSVPIALARWLIFAGSILLSGLAGWSIWRAASPLALRLYAGWQAVVGTPLGWVMVALLAAGGAWLGVDQPAIWIGYRLLSLFFLTWLLIVLLAHPRQHDEGFQRRVWWIVPVVVLGIGTAIRVGWVLADQVWTDEGFHLSAAAGMLAGKSIAPANMFFPSNVIIPPWRGFAFGIYRLWAGLFGLGLLQMRALAFLFGLLALPFIFGSLQLWYDRRTALVGTSLISLAWLLMMSSLGRNDSLPMLAVGITLFAHLYAWKHDRPILHALVGLLVGLSLETHFAVAPIVLAWSAFYAIDYARQAMAARRLFVRAPLWPYLAGLLPVIAAYLVVHVALLPDPAGFLRTFRAFVSDRNFGFDRVSSTLARLHLYWVEAPFEPLLIAISLLAALLRRSEADRHWLGLFALTLLGYALLGTDPQISHTIYALPIWLAGLGPLVTRGWGRQRWMEGLLPLGVYLVIASLLANSTLQELVIDHESRVYFDARYTEEAAVIRQYLHPGDAVIAPPIYIPYLIDDTQTFLHNYFPGAERGPLLAGEDPSRYWQTVLLETWPTIRIEAEGYVNPEVPIQIDYTRALHAVEIAPHIWYVDRDVWTVDLPAPPADISTPLLLVAHQPPLRAGSTLTLQSAWANRQALSDDIDVTVSLRNEKGQPAAATTEPLIGGWDETPTSAWDRPGFHDAAFTMPLPVDLPAGTYSLHLTVESPPALCQPWCDVTLGPVTIP